MQTSKSWVLMLTSKRLKHSFVRKPLKKIKPKIEESSITFQHLIEENEAKHGKIEDHAAVDRLPQGLKLSNLPKFDRVLGWDKSNPVLKQILKDVKEAKSSSNQKEVILLEGKRTIIDAINAGCRPKHFIFSRLNLLEDIPFEVLQKEPGFKMTQIPYKNINVWSDLSTSPGIMALFELQQVKNQIKVDNDKALPLTIILDDVRMPDNVGALARVAASFGCKKLITTKVRFYFIFQTSDK